MNDVIKKLNDAIVKNENQRSAKFVVNSDDYFARLSISYTDDLIEPKIDAWRDLGGAKIISESKLKTFDQGVYHNFTSKSVIFIAWARFPLSKDSRSRAIKDFMISFDQELLNFAATDLLKLAVLHAMILGDFDKIQRLGLNLRMREISQTLNSEEQLFSKILGAQVYATSVDKCNYIVVVLKKSGQFKIFVAATFIEAQRLVKSNEKSFIASGVDRYKYLVIKYMTEYFLIDNS